MILTNHFLAQAAARGINRGLVEEALKSKERYKSSEPGRLLALLNMGKQTLYVVVKRAGREEVAITCWIKENRGLCWLPPKRKDINYDQYTRSTDPAGPWDDAQSGYPSDVCS